MKKVPSLRLYHFPGACSQVVVFSLEEAELDYTIELLDISRNQQSKPEFKSKLPLGKVPTLLIDGEPLTENAALQIYIASRCPEAGLLPSDPDPRVQADGISGLSFCGSTLHPIVRGILNPSRLTTGDGAPVRERAIELAHKSFGFAERRIAERGWWMGSWSVIDVYLNWAFSIAKLGGYDTSALPHLSRLTDRLMERPAFLRMLKIEDRARTTLGL